MREITCGVFSSVSTGLTMTSRFVYSAMLSLLVASSVAAQTGRSTLSVGVSDAQTGAPIVGAEVVMPDQKKLVRTDSLGQARISGVPFGEHPVRVRMLGYVPGEVDLKFAGDTTGVVFRLERSTQTLTEIDVKAPQVPQGLKDFEMRRKQALGRYLTEKELTANANKDFILLASATFPGLTMRTDESGQVHLAGSRNQCGADASMANPKRGVDRIGGKPGLKPELGAREGFDDFATGSCQQEKPCLVNVYLDDISLGETDAGIIRTWDLSGAEYYTANTVPVRYRRNSGCGVLLLWSMWH
jgi:hypothetical protein